jgi:hypothetical protein
MLYDIFQATVVGLLVAGCALYCVFSLAPKALVRRLKTGLLGCPLPGFARTRLQASLVQPGGCGACDGCSSSGPSQASRRVHE